jgi:predicted CoA-binding protein
MPRRKKYTLSAKELPIYEMIVEELSKNPELAANYDMATIEKSYRILPVAPNVKDKEDFR